MIIKLFIVSGYTPHHDDSCTLRLRTALEASDKDIHDFHHLRKRHVVVAIKPDDSPFTTPELDDLDKIDIDLYDKNKSPSKRLRNVLWILHREQLGQDPTEEQFREFYRIKMEQVIDHFKSKLE